jgi:hypothetical protein
VHRGTPRLAVGSSSLQLASTPTIDGCGIDISKRETIHERLSHDGLAAYNHRRTEDL